MADLPRGIRNNNPGNIVLSDIPWLGKTQGEDDRFETFESAEAGLRALSLNLLNYSRKYNLSTVKDIISRWAPPNENDTGSYVGTVARKLGIDPDAPIDLENSGLLARLTEAIVSHENGMNPYKSDQYLMAAESARNKTDLATPLSNSPKAPVTVPEAPPELVPIQEAPRLAKLTGLTQEQIAQLPIDTGFYDRPAEPEQPTNESRLANYARYLTQNQDKANTPEFKTVAQAYLSLRGVAGPSEAPAETPAGETPKEKAGFFSSALDAASTIFSGAKAAEFAAKDETESRKALLEARESKYATTPLSEVSGVGDFVDWLKQQGGAMAGYLAVPGAAATLTNILTKAPGPARAVGYGMLGAQYAIDNLTRTAGEQEEQIQRGEEPTPVNLPKVLVASTAQTALDVAGFKFFEPAFAKFPWLKNLVGEGAEKTAKEAEDILVDAFNNGSLSTTRGVVTGIGKGAAFEIPQEIAQQALERWQAGLPLTDKDARDEYVEAGAAALIFGGALGGTAGVLENAGKRSEAEEILRKRAADKVKAQEPETTTVETTAVQPPGERTEAPGPEGEPGITQLLGELAPVTATTPAAAVAKKKGPQLAEFETLDEPALAQFRQAAATANVPPEMMQEFETRFTEIQAERASPRPNNFKLRAQVKKNAKLYRKIQKMIAEPAAAVPFEAPASTEAPATTTAMPRAYQRPVRGGVPVPPGGGVSGPQRSDIGAEPGGVLKGAGVSVPPPGTETGTKAPATGGLGGAGKVSTAPAGGKRGPAPALDISKDIKRVYAGLLTNLSEIEKVAPKEEVSDVEVGEMERRKAPVTEKELKAIPTDPKQLLELANKAVAEKKLDTFNFNRIQNMVKSAQARPGFDPATDLQGIRETVAKLMRPVERVKTESGYKATINNLKQLLKEAEQMELNPESRQFGAQARERIGKEISKLRAQLKLPAKTLPRLTPVTNEPAELREAREVEAGIKGKSILEIADYLIDAAPNQVSKAIAERVRERLEDYLKAGYRISVRVINRGELSRSPLKNTYALGSHEFTPEQGTSEIYLLGSDLPRNGYGTAYTTVLHELVHAVTSHAIVLGARAKQGTRLYNANKKLKDLYTEVNRYFKRRRNLSPNMLTDLERSVLNGANALKNERELVAWALTDKKMQDYLESIPYKGTASMWDRFVQAIRELLGIDASKDTALSELLRVSYELTDSQIVKDTAALRESTSGVGRSDTLSGDGRVSFDEIRKAAPPNVPETPEQVETRLAQEVREKTGQNAGIRKTVKDILTYRNTEELIRLFQNERRPLKRLQEALAAAGRMIVGTEGFNNIYDLIMLSSGKAFHLMTRDIQPHIMDMQRAINDYAKVSNLDINSALGRLHMYMMALHEPERRLMKYLRNVPLDNKTKLNVGGKEMTPADVRDAIYRELTKDVDLTKKGPDGKTAAQQLRERLEEIVAKYKDPKGFSPVGFKSIELSDAEYNVIGGYTKAQIDAMQQQYKADPHKAELSALISAMKKLQENTIKLDKMANYWSQPTTNLTAFYGYQNYVPFKGKPKSEVTKGDEVLDLGYSRISSKDFNEFAYGTEGRLSDSDNPVIQTMVDGAKASVRAGREGVSQSLKNLINQKHIKGKLFKTITFEQRFNGFDPAEVMGKNMYFHYMPNGTIEVYEILEADQPISEAIRRTFRANTPILDKINGLTSGIGALHTRYNPAFHPYNFVRDVLTNTWTVAAEKGGKVAYDFIGAVARQVADNGFYKAGKISSLYADAKLDEIKRMVYNPDGSVKDQSALNVLEFLEEGGRVSYVMGMAMKGQVENMLKEVGRSKIVQTKDQFNTIVDTWTDAFEFTSRAAAYGAMKSTYIAEATKRFKQRAGRNPTKAEADVIEKQSRQRAAAYAKELANFEQVGVYGREAGAAFMFFRPAATGAVRAIDALRPAFETFNQAVSHLPASLRNDPEALAEFKRNYDERRETAINTIVALAGAGAFAYMMAVLAAEDDEEGRNRVLTDNMDIWTRNLRFPIKFMNPILGKDNDFLNVPWGFGGGAFSAMGAQLMGVALGGNSLGNAIGNMASITLDSFVPIPFARFNPTDNPAAWLVDSILPSALRPAVEYVMNVDTFGKQIYNSRTSRYGDAYSGGEYVPESYKKVTRFLAEISGGAINWQPQTVAFFANNYADGLSRVVTNTHGLFMTIAGNKDFDFKRDTTVFDSFIGKKSSVDAREFAEVEKQIVEMRDTMNMFKNRPDGGAALLKYIEDNPEAPILVNYYNQVVNGPMRTARERLNTMSSSDLPPNQRKPTVDMLRQIRDMYAKSFVDLAETYGVEP